MAKKGSHDTRRSSGITSAQVRDALLAEQFTVLSTAEPPAPKTAFRHAVTQARRELQKYVTTPGHVARVSTTGDSFFMGHGTTEVMLPLKDHMTDNALAAIEAKTGVHVTRLRQQQHKHG